MELWVLIEDIFKFYHGIESTEIWAPETLDSTFKQIEYYIESGLFKDANTVISILDDLVLFLKYPNIDDFTKIIDMEATDPLVNYVIMVSCLDTLATEDEVHNFADYTPEDIADFMDNLTGDIIKKISNFFDTMPKLRQELKYTNSNEDEKVFVIEGMRSFFI